MSTISFGIMGTANIANKFCEAAKNTKTDVLFVASSDLERAKKFAIKNNIPSFGCYENLIKHKDINAIYICGNNDVHFSHAKMCLENGKNVLIEKPACTSAFQWQTLLDIAKAKGVFVMEAMWMAYLPFIQILKNQLKNLGKIKYVTSNFAYNISKVSYKDISRVFALENFGGSLYDLGVYNLHLVYILLGKPREITAVATLSDQRIDTSINMLLQYDFGTVHLSCGIDYLGSNTFEIFSENANIVIPNFSSAKYITLNNKKIDATYAGNGFEYEILAFEKSVQSAECPIVKGESTLEVLKIVESALAQVHYGNLDA